MADSSGADGAGPASTASPRALDDAGVRFLQADHARALQRLHAEVALLQQRNADLSFKLLLTEQMSADLIDARTRIAALEIREAALVETVATESDRAAAAEAEVRRLRENEARALERECALKRDIARLTGHTESELRERMRSQVNALERGAAPPMTASAVKVTYTDMASPPVLARVGSAPIRGGGVGTDVGSGEWVAHGAVTDVVPSPPRKPPPRRQSSRPRADLLRRASSFAAAAASKRHDAASDAGADGLSGGGGGGGNGGGGQAERVEQLPHFPEPVPPIRTLSSPR